MKKDNKTMIVRLRLTEKEYKKLCNDSAKTSFKDFSSYVRYLLFSKQINIIIDERISVENRLWIEKKTVVDELRYEINKIGNNINQIAKKVNSSGKFSKVEINDLLKKMDRLVDIYSNLKI